MTVSVHALAAIALLSAGSACSDTSSVNVAPERDRMTEPAPQSASLPGEWILSGPAGECRFTLSGEIAEARAGGDLPPPMQGARQDGDCGLSARIGGWRSKDGGAIELVDAYGAAIVTLDPRDGGFAAAQGGLTLRRP